MKKISRDEEYISMLKSEYEKNAKNMKYEAKKILNNEHDSEDAVQNVFEKLIKNKSYMLYGDESAVKYYLIVAARNEAKRVYKKNYGHGYPELIDDNINIESKLDTEELIIKKETRKVISDFVMEKNNMYSDPFLLHYFFNHTMEEIALLLDMKEETVRKGIYRLKIEVIAFLRREE